MPGVALVWTSLGATFQLWEVFGLLEEGEIGSDNRVLGVWPFGQSYCDPNFHLLLHTVFHELKEKVESCEVWKLYVLISGFLSTAFCSSSSFTLDWLPASLGCILFLLCILRLSNNSTKSLLIPLGDHLSFLCIPIAMSCTSPVRVHDLLLEHILYLTLRCLAESTKYILMYFSPFRRSILKSYSPVETMTVMPCIFLNLLTA